MITKARHMYTHKFTFLVDIVPSETWKVRTDIPLLEYEPDYYTDKDTDVISYLESLIPNEYAEIEIVVH